LFAVTESLNTTFACEFLFGYNGFEWDIIVERIIDSLFFWRNNCGCVSIVFGGRSLV
jgi:hypothetical protein